MTAVPDSRLDLRRLLAAAEAASPLDGVAALGEELVATVGAIAVSFLIADYSGHSLVRLSRATAAGSPTSRSGSARVIPLAGSAQGETLRTQHVQVRSEGEAFRVYAPVTDRGEALGILELTLPDAPDDQIVDHIASAAHALAYVVITNRRYTDLFEWGQRTRPPTLAAEIQRRLLPPSFTCEAGPFTVAGWLEPAELVGGDTFDYTLDRDALHISISDAMGHGVDAALLATLLVAGLRNSRRRGMSLREQAEAGNDALAAHLRADQFVTGQLIRVDLNTGVAEVVNAGHTRPVRVRDGRVTEIVLEADPPFGIFRGTRYRVQQLALEPGDRLVLLTDGMVERNAARAPLTELLTQTRDLHPREAVQTLTGEVADAADGQLRDDATVFILDWYGSDQFDRDASTGASPHRAST